MKMNSSIGREWIPESQTDDWPFLQTDFRTYEMEITSESEDFVVMERKDYCKNM